MGFLNILTLVFVVAKIAGAIDWPWLGVFCPTIAAVVLWLAAIVFVALNDD